MKRLDTVPQQDNQILNIRFSTDKPDLEFADLRNDIMECLNWHDKKVKLESEMRYRVLNYAETKGTDTLVIFDKWERVCIVITIENASKLIQDEQEFSVLLPHYQKINCLI